MMLFFLPFFLKYVLAVEAPLKEAGATIFEHTQELYKEDYVFSFSWSINPTLDSIHALLQLTSTLQNNSLAGSYVSLGIGAGMLDAHFIISQSKLKNGSVDVSEYYSSGKYSFPQQLDQNLVKVAPILGGESVKSHWIEFTRPLQGFKASRFNENLHHLDINDQVFMIWAFNPNNGGGSRVIKTHDADHRGIFKVNLSDGSIVSETDSRYSVKLIHGYGMLAIWFGFMPFGIFVARYCRSKNGWLLVKIMNQSTASILLFTLFFYVLTSSPVLGSIHSILGLILLMVILLQIIFGVTAKMGMSISAMEKFRRLGRRFHMFTGWGILIIAMVTCGYGIDILYPYSRFQPIWYYFFSLLGLWTATFICAESYYQLKFKSNVSFAEFHNDMKKQQQFNNKFTWESINQDVKNGRKYVVAHGKYVYDISRWLSSHPGGQLILEDCCGTDITNDYFHEAGFDAKEFNQKHIPSRLLKKKSNILETVLSNADSVALERQNSSKSIASIRMSHGGGISFEKSDWKHIQRARRTHVHTKLAIEKLSSLMVGTMVSDSMDSATEGDNNTVLAEGQITFSEFEFRRYAMTKKTVESNQFATRPFLRIRFCLLYPYDQRAKQPRRFQPGQCIELELRLPNGKRISRFYTPLNGDLNAFEILVKVVPDGKVSSHLYHSIAGESQFKIRGPFGTPFAPVESLWGHEQFFDTIYAFAGGSGITPFLQLINHLLLPLHTPLRVGQRQDSYQAGELYLDVGDYVEVTHHFPDGWAFGTNMKTGEQGAFSLTCIVPFSPTRIVLFHFSENQADYMGKKELEMAQSIYPHLLEVHFLSSRNLVKEKIAMHLENTSPNIQVIVCGPAGLNAKIVDILSGFGQFWIEKLRLMKNNSWF